MSFALFIDEPLTADRERLDSRCITPAAASLYLKGKNMPPPVDVTLRAIELVGERYTDKIVRVLQAIVESANVEIGEPQWLQIYLMSHDDCGGLVAAYAYKQHFVDEVLAWNEYESITVVGRVFRDRDERYGLLVESMARSGSSDETPDASLAAVMSLCHQCHQEFVSTGYHAYCPDCHAAIVNRHRLWETNQHDVQPEQRTMQPDAPAPPVVGMMWDEFDRALRQVGGDLISNSGTFGRVCDFYESFIGYYDDDE